MTSTKTPEEPDFTWKTALAIVATIVVLWVLSYVVIWTFFGNLEDASKFGDIFGAVNALFSGLALSGVLIAILLQRKELQLQRKELELTRRELSRSAKAQEASEKALAKQAEALAVTAALNRDSYMPIILVDVYRGDEYQTVTLENVGKFGALKVYALAVAEYWERETPEVEFRARYPKDYELIVDEVEHIGKSFHLKDSFHTTIVPPDMGGTGTLFFPLFPHRISVLVQFRQPQGTHFSQQFHFTRFGESYELTMVNPDIPVEAIRVVPDFKGGPKGDKTHRNDLGTDDGSALPGHVQRTFAPGWSKSIAVYLVIDEDTVMRSRLRLFNRKA